MTQLSKMVSQKIITSQTKKHLDTYQWDLSLNLDFNWLKYAQQIHHIKTVSFDSISNHASKMKQNLLETSTGAKNRALLRTVKDFNIFCWMHCALKCFITMVHTENVNLVMSIKNVSLGSTDSYTKLHWMGAWPCRKLRSQLDLF